MTMPRFNSVEIGNVFTLYSTMLEDLKLRKRKENGSIYEHDGYTTLKESLLYDKFILEYDSFSRITNTNPHWWRDLEEVITLIELQPVIELLKSFSDKRAASKIMASLAVRWSRIHDTRFEYAKTTQRNISIICAQISILMEEATGLHRKNILMPPHDDNESDYYYLQMDQPIPYLHQKFFTEENVATLNEKQREIMRDWLKTTWLETILFYLCPDDYLFEDEHGNQINSLGNHEIPSVILFLEIIGREHLIDYMCSRPGFTDKSDLIITMLNSVRDGEEWRVIELLGFDFLKRHLIYDATQMTLGTMHGHYFLELLELLDLPLPDRHWYPDGKAYEYFDLMRYPIHLRIPIIELFCREIDINTFDAKTELEDVLGDDDCDKLFQAFAKISHADESLYEELNEHLLTADESRDYKPIFGLVRVLSLLPDDKGKAYLELFEAYWNEIAEIYAVPNVNLANLDVAVSKHGIFGNSFGSAIEMMPLDAVEAETLSTSIHI